MKKRKIDIIVSNDKKFDDTGLNAKWFASWNGEFKKGGGGYFVAAGNTPTKALANLIKHFGKKFL